MINVPIRTVSEINEHCHWRIRHNRVKSQRQATAYCLHGKEMPTLPCLVKLTRVGGNHLDDDNLRSALKAVRDEVAKWLNINDGGTLVKWEYAEKPGRVQQSVLIEWESGSGSSD